MPSVALNPITGKLDLVERYGPNIGGFTAGSVLFADTDGTLTQDNASLFYDNTNDRLGVGAVSGAPTAGLHVVGYQIGKAGAQGFTIQGFADQVSAANSIYAESQYAGVGARGLSILGIADTSFDQPGAISFSPRLRPRANITTAYGVIGIANIDAGTGNITGLYNQHYRVDIGAGYSGVVNNAYVFSIDKGFGAGGKPNNYYGLRAANLYGAGNTDAWAIYSEGGGVYFTPGAATQKGPIIRAWAGQAANLMEWQDSLGAVLASIGPTGQLRIADGTQGAGKVLTSDADGDGSWAAPTGPTLPIMLTVPTGDETVTASYSTVVLEEYVMSATSELIFADPSEMWVA